MIIDRLFPFVKVFICNPFRIIIILIFYVFLNFSNIFNGFGRIGRLCVRAALLHDDVEIVAINSTSNPEGTAHLFQYDSTHGTYRGDVSYSEDSLIVDGKKIRLLSDRDPKNLPWGDLGVDIVI